ncbi:MAG: porphobilinogen synthase [Desulfurococcales archaeon]|nr:porphobilinogen synthase [Desulfurococcales archaeon]
MFVLPEFPVSRPRRLRLTTAIRDLVRDVSLSPSDLVLPVFVSEALERPAPIESLPGHYYYPPTSKELVDHIGRALELGVKAFLLFGVPKVKDEAASRAYASDGPVQEAIRHIRKEIGWEPVIAADLCICGYASHGHCGVPKKCRRGVCIDNDATLEIYRRIAVSQADAGADIIAPSGMMDGQVKAIREALDGEGFSDVSIMSYSVKYASSFYGPFRDVMDSAPRWGDRRSYQMDPGNTHDILKEALLDVAEGADILMVKPALPYLDVIYRLHTTITTHPLAAYNVSGEYMMVKLLAEGGYGDYNSLMLEVLTSIKRAGADIIITYHALDAAKLLRG